MVCVFPRELPAGASAAETTLPNGLQRADETP